METTTQTPAAGSTAAIGAATRNAVNAKIDSAATAAHRATDAASDTMTAQMGKLSSSAHSAVDGAAAATKSLSDTASDLSQQAMQWSGDVKESACASIRANPLATVAGALAVGYLIGRIARL